jgi:hypothetical protein
MKVMTTQISNSLGPIWAEFKGKALAATLAAGLVTLASIASARADSGNVLPPSANTHGYSLVDMASAVANFSISGNDPAFYPNTPFQIIYNRPGNSYTVEPGTTLYLKFFFVDDSAPVVGDWPANKAQVANYVFGPDQLGGHDLQVEVDGRMSSLDKSRLHGRPGGHPGFTGWQRTHDSNRSIRYAAEQGNPHDNHSRGV